MLAFVCFFLDRNKSKSRQEKQPKAARDRMAIDDKPRRGINKQEARFGEVDVGSVASLAGRNIFASRPSSLTIISEALSVVVADHRLSRDARHRPNLKSCDLSRTTTQTAAARLFLSALIGRGASQARPASPRNLRNQRVRAHLCQHSGAFDAWTGADQWPHGVRTLPHRERHVRKLRQPKFRRRGHRLRLPSPSSSVTIVILCLLSLFLSFPFRAPTFPVTRSKTTHKIKTKNKRVNSICLRLCKLCLFTNPRQSNLKVFT